MKKEDAKISGIKIGYMRRSSLIEFLVRLSKAKYVDTKIMPTCTSAFKRLLNETILSQNIVEKWQEFRENYIWTLEVDDLIKANYDFICSIYTEIADPKTKKLGYKQCIETFTNIGNSLESVKFCYGMSKMTVHLDSHTSYYMTMEQVEFIEMICRIADKKFRGTELSGEELSVKTGRQASQ